MTPAGEAEERYQAWPVRRSLVVLAGFALLIAGLAVVVGLEPLRLFSNRLIMPAFLLFILGGVIAVGRIISDSWRGERAAPASRYSAAGATWVVLRMSVPLSLVLLCAALIVTNVADMPVYERVKDGTLLVFILAMLVMSFSHIGWAAAAGLRRLLRNRG